MLSPVSWNSHSVYSFDDDDDDAGAARGDDDEDAGTILNDDDDDDDGVGDGSVLMKSMIDDMGMISSFIHSLEASAAS